MFLSRRMVSASVCCVCAPKMFAIFSDEIISAWRVAWSVCIMHAIYAFAHTHNGRVVLNSLSNQRPKNKPNSGILYTDDGLELRDIIPQSAPV